MGMTKKQALRKLRSKAKKVARRTRVNGRKIRRKVRRKSKVFARIGKRIARKQGKKALRRLRRSGGFAKRLIRSGPKRLVKRWIKRKARKIVRGKTTRVTMSKTIGDTRVRRGSGGRHDIVPGRTMVEWRPVPQLGRGRVLAFLPGRNLDVEFEGGGRPANGVPIEEVRVLA